MSISNIFKTKKQRYYDNAIKSGASHQQAKLRSRTAVAKMNKASAEVYSWTGSTEAALRVEGGNVRHYL